MPILKHKSITQKSFISQAVKNFFKAQFNKKFATWYCIRAENLKIL